MQLSRDRPTHRAPTPMQSGSTAETRWPRSRPPNPSCPRPPPPPRRAPAPNRSGTVGPWIPPTEASRRRRCARPRPRGRQAPSAPATSATCGSCPGSPSTTTTRATSTSSAWPRRWPAARHACSSPSPTSTRWCGRAARMDDHAAPTPPRSTRRRRLPHAAGGALHRPHLAARRAGAAGRGGRHAGAERRHVTGAEVYRALVLNHAKLTYDASRHGSTATRRPAAACRGAGLRSSCACTTRAGGCGVAPAPRRAEREDGRPRARCSRTAGWSTCAPTRRTAPRS